MLRPLLRLLLSASFMATPISSRGDGDDLDLFVSPTGSDANSGTIERPLKTLHGARYALRRHIRDGLAANATVHLRGGTYRLRETLVLDLRDVAPNGRTITWRGYQQETAVISSGVPVTGWRKSDAPLAGMPSMTRKHVWVADLPEGLDRILTLYEGDARLPRARTEAFAPDTDLHPRDNPSDQLDRSTFYFPEGFVRHLPNLEDVELFILPSYPWWMNILSFESVDETKRIARTTIPGTDYLCPMVSYAQRAFPKNAWIENTPAALDSPGEWIVNSRTRKIHHWPTEAFPSETLFAPSLRELVRVEGVNDPEGNDDQPVRGIRFKNLQFTQADRGVWHEDDAGIQHDWEMVDKDNAMLRFRGAEDCSVERCRFFNAGGNGIRMDLYAQKISVEHCLFERLGQSAIMIIGYGPGVKDVNHHNRVVNNHVRFCGEIYLHSQMITVFQSGHNYIGHNYIHHVPRKAICITGVRSHWLLNGETDRRECVNTIRWNEIGDAKKHEDLLPFLHARNNIIEYNAIHDVLQELGDGAAVNLSGSGDGNIVRLNHIHDIPANHATSAIRMDGSQTGVLVEKNVIANIGTGGITPKERNTVRNNFIINVCARGNAGFVRALGVGEGTEQVGAGLSNIERNIFFNPRPDRSFYSRHRAAHFTAQEFAQRIIDYNVYFCPGTTGDDWPDLEALREKGADRHSLFSDPMFLDWENGDFALHANSPALKLGIEQIDIRPAGLTDSFPPEWR